MERWLLSCLTLLCTLLQSRRCITTSHYYITTGHVERISVTTHHGDVRKQCDLEQAFRGADLVFHLASMIEVAAFPDYKLLEEINVTGEFLEVLHGSAVKNREL